MPSLPIPLFIALLLFYLTLKAQLQGIRPLSLRFLLLVCALQNLILSLNLHYGFHALQLVQPVTATILPPLAYIAFQSASVRPLRMSRDLWHILPPLLTVATILLAPAFLDTVIPALFLGYGLAILIQLAGGSDQMPLASLDKGNLPLVTWRAIAIALIVSAASDALIAYDHMIRNGEWSLWIITLSSGLTLLTIGFLSLSQAQNEEQRKEPDTEEENSPASNEEERELIARLESLLDQEPLYLDPDLTLKRLARRMGVPVKALSSAINRQYGQNTSRLINSYRIRHACKLLLEGQSVLNASIDSGFHSKSNFNREFQRIQGCSPTQWRDIKLDH
ncbi:helix-turn-helix domain-containing protein [Kiloniella sp. b19]|uniref:helix-turn-helix domain-containing protein n=1 Tax=Kiloniella sp. GXU_MW_B19 TaxID=3141326 RepID=UPI0031D8362C